MAPGFAVFPFPFPPAGLSAGPARFLSITGRFHGRPEVREKARPGAKTVAELDSAATVRPMRRVCPNRPPAALLVLLMAELAAVPWTAAQSPASSFEALKKAHGADVARTVEPLRENYCRALMALERSLAAKGDYAGARAVRKERTGIEELMKTAGASGAVASANPASAENMVMIPATLDKEGRVILSPESAETAGGAKLDDSKKYLTGWTVAGALARWLLPPGLPEGGYDVEVSFSLFPASPSAEAAIGKGGGTFEIRENFHTLTRALTAPEPATAASAGTPSADVKTSDPSGTAPPAPSPGNSGRGGSEETFTVVLGTLRLGSNAARLEVKLGTPEPAMLLQVRSLRLIPVASSSS